MKTINVAQVISPNLLSRILADDLYTYIKNTAEKEIAIDFVDVHFVSRSFMDEFYNLVVKPSDKPFEALIINMPPDVEATLEAVRATQDQKKQILTAEVVKAATLNDVDKCFMALSI